MLTSDNRKESFKKFLENLTDKPRIVEIGCSRHTKLEDGIGDGNSTFFFAQYIQKNGGSLDVVDISEDNLENCKKLLKNNKIKLTNIKFHLLDGLDFLDYNKEKIDAIYLDGLDYDSGREYASAIFHFQAMRKAEKWLLPGSLIMIDDMFSLDPMRGKGELVIPYLKKAGYDILYLGYQCVLRRKGLMFQEVLGHASFIAKTGYGAHSRDFFTALNKRIPVRIRNFAHELKLDHLTQEQKSMIIHQTWTHEPFELGSVYERKPDTINIVLMETNHSYFYEEYEGPKIAYNVWESTLQPDYFFKKLLEFDQIWVPTEWQRQCTINQGAPAEKVKVVPEGVDGMTYHPAGLILDDGIFRFMIFGRWDYRKYITEQIQAWLDVFGDNENVELLLSVDNPFPVDGMKSTEERLKHHGFIHPRIKNLGYVPREDYVRYLQNNQCMLFASRSEGWGLPGIEAAACGTPVILTDWGAVLEYGKYLKTRVKVKEFRSPQNVFMQDSAVPGVWAEPDYEHLKEMMLDIYNNYEKYRADALKASDVIRHEFDWSNAAKKAQMILEEFHESKKEVIENNDDIFVIDCYPNDLCKTKVLCKTIEKLKATGKDVALVGHFPIPQDIQDHVDYVIYDKNNPLGEFEPLYWYSYPKNVKIIYHGSNLYHGAACYTSIKNAAKAFAGRYNFVHFVEYDIDFDVDEYLKFVDSMRLSDKKFIGFPFVEADIKDGYKVEGIITNLFSFEPKWLNNILPDIKTWQEYEALSRKQIAEDIIFEPWFKNIIGNKSDMMIATEEMKGEFIKKMNIIDHGGMDSGVNFLRSETIDGKILIFAINHSDETQVCSVEMDGLPYQEMLVGRGACGYVGVEKKDCILTCKSAVSEKTFLIETTKTYDDVLFKFYDDKILCVRWDAQYNGDFLDVDGEDKINISYIDGVKFEPTGKDSAHEYNVKFYEDRELIFEAETETNMLWYETNLQTNNWAKPTPRYYVNWRVEVERDGEHFMTDTFDVKGKDVMIILDSKALGDTLAWLPYMEEFRKKHECTVYAATFHNALFENEYPDLKFIWPGEFRNSYAMYSIGVRDNDYASNRTNWKVIPLQQAASDYLGLQYKPIRPKITIPDKPSPFREPYVTITDRSTMRPKVWNNPRGWQAVVDYLVSRGIRVVSISREPCSLKNVTCLNGNDKSIFDTINQMRHSKFFIGLPSGLSWLAWALDLPHIMISGFSEPWTEYSDPKLIRIGPPEGKCHGCFNDPTLDFTRDWEWCARNKDYECTREITPEKVIYEINKLL